MASNVNGVLLEPKDDMVVKISNKRNFEPLTFDRWCKLADPGSVLIDVGSYTGLYAIAAAQRKATVYAFEPNPVVFRRLLSNIRANRVEVNARNIALWDSSGTKKLSLRGGNALTSAGSLVKRHGPSIDVSTLPLDSYDLTDIRAIKIDAERAEVEVVKGAMNTIRQSLPTIFAEVLDAELGDRLDQLLRPLGYRRGPLDSSMFVWSKQ